MGSKIFAIIILILAILMAVLVSVLPQDQLANLFYVSRFFEVMIPILGVGALLKYLFCFHHCRHGQKYEERQP